MNSVAYSWMMTERRITDFIAQHIGGLEGVRYYVPEDYPRAILDDMPSGEPGSQWTFEIEGGDDPNIRSPLEQRNADTMWMLASFRAAALTRTIAREMAGAVWGLFPAGKSTVPLLADIAEAQPTGYPQLIPDVMTTRAGKDVRVWSVRIPFWVVYSIINEET